MFGLKRVLASLGVTGNLQTRLGVMTGERDGYKHAYEITATELGQLKATAAHNTPPTSDVPQAGSLYRPVFNYDGLKTDPAIIHNHDFMRDPRYVAAFQAGETAFGLDHKMYWRLHVALWCAGQASQIKGDFVECGVWRGFLSTAIMTWLDWPALTKRFFLFDTFDGMVTDRLSDSEKADIEKLNHLNSHYRDNYEFVCQHFAKFPRVEIVRGPVPDTLASADIEAVAFLSLDMNCAAPEIAAAEHFWPKMPTGAIILLDDYVAPEGSGRKAGTPGRDRLRRRHRSAYIRRRWIRRLPTRLLWGAPQSRSSQSCPPGGHQRPYRKA